MVFPAANTWPSFLACIGFQAIVYFLCFHRRGSELAELGPSLLGRWLKRSSNGAAAPRRKIKPPASVSQSWRLGALHERFFKGTRAGDESTLREAGEVLGQSLTEEEFLSLARVSERAVHRSRWCCNLSDCMLVAGILGAIFTIRPAVYYLTTPIPSTVMQIITAVVDLVRATPMILLCLFTLTISLALVCDGFRAADHSVGGRIALTGVLGAVASLYYSTMWGSWTHRDELEMTRMVTFGFFYVSLLPITVKFDFALGGFIAAFCTVYFGGLASGVFFKIDGFCWAIVVGSLVVNALFGLALLCRVPSRALQPFSSGVMAMGVSVLHLAFFSISYDHSHYFWYKGPVWPHMVYQLPVYVCLVVGWVLGKYIGCEGLTNNTRLFGVLYVFTSIISVSEHTPGQGGASVGWAIVSLGAWRVGLYLHGHQGFVSSLWTLDASRLRCACWAGVEDTSDSHDD